ncbi:MAG: hypothetical protein ACJ8F1_08985 [Polyangia bacterium]
MRQMVLAGGVVVAGCSSGQLAGPDAAGTGGTASGYGGSGTGGSGTGGAAGAPGSGGNGGAAGSGGTIFTPPCGNANPDPCICGRPDASAGSAALCEQKMTCEAGGGVWTYFSNKCTTNVDAGADAQRADGDARDR